MVRMADDLFTKATRFRAPHRGEGTFVIPNAWDACTARVLAAAGCEALGTTSAGVNLAAGHPDYDDAAPPEMLGAGTFGYAAGQIPDDGMCDLMRGGPTAASD
jgi:2-methylisocitrate lyase-like PEP mutase family enzyme